jgi:hypothetical protein
MGTIIINGKRFDGNNATIRDGKVVIDGKPQDGEVHGDVELQVVEGGSGSVECVASVTCGEVGGDVATGAIRAVAFASVGTGPRKMVLKPGTN